MQRLQTTLQEEPANASASACHGIAVRELSRHRLVVPEHCILYKASRTTNLQLASRREWPILAAIHHKRDSTQLPLKAAHHKPYVDIISYYDGLH